MGLALQQFVDKDEKDAIGEIVKLQLHHTQETLSKKNIRDEDIEKEVVKETERSRAEEPSQEENERRRKVSLLNAEFPCSRLLKISIVFLIKLLEDAMRQSRSKKQNYVPLEEEVEVEITRATRG